MNGGSLAMKRNYDVNSVTYASGAAFLGEKKGVSNLIRAFSKLIHEKGRNDLLYLYGKIDDDIREQLHAELAPCSEKDFMEAYIKAHLEKYGFPFEV